MQILCSTGAFTRSSDPLSHEAILRYGQAFVADGLEIIFYPRWYQKQEHIVDALRSSKLLFPVLHMEKSIGECFGSNHPGEQEQGMLRFKQNCAFAQQIGAHLAVLHLWGMPSADTHLEQNLRPLAHCLISDLLSQDMRRLRRIVTCSYVNLSELAVKARTILLRFCTSFNRSSVRKSVGPSACHP